MVSIAKMLQNGQMKESFMKQESNLENNCHDDHFTIWGYTAENTSIIYSNTPTQLRVIKSASTWPSPMCALLNTGVNVPMQGE